MGSFRFLALVISTLVGGVSPSVADADGEKQHLLEGEVRIHPKYLYKYYLAFGDGQTCALYGAKHEREDAALAKLKAGERVRVRGVLGTYFHPGDRKGNLSPFPASWVLYMDVKDVLLLGQNREPRKVSPVIRVGMTLQEVIDAKGRHYRRAPSPKPGSWMLVYDDISVYFDSLRAGVASVRQTDLDDANWFLNDTPYADEMETQPADASGSPKGGF